MNAQGWQQRLHTWVAKLRELGERMPFALRLGLALVFFALGIAGLFLPILQGGLFLFISLWLIFPRHSERWLEKLKAFLRTKKTDRISKKENVL